MTKLRAQLRILEDEAKARTLAREFSQKYPRLKYEEIIADKIDQIQKEISRLQKSLPAP
jgi:lambda repressor-like predicted transcriptional regulator